MPIFGLSTQKDVQTAIEAALKAQAEQYPQWLLETAGNEKWSLPSAHTYEAQAEQDRTSASVSVAVDILTRTAAGAKHSVVRLDGEKEEEVTNHPLEMLFDNPNDEDSGYEFWWWSYKMRVLTGNCYWWLNRKDQFSPPEEIWLIPSHLIMPVPDENNYLAGYMYDPDGSPYPTLNYGIPLETWEVVHFRRPNPFSRFIGLSPLEALIVDIVGEKAAKQWNARLFGENNALLPGILAFRDPIQETDWENIKREINTSADKRKYLMLRGVGEGGISWMQASATHREMEFLEGLNVSRDTIWNALAPGIVSMLDPSATEASSKTGKGVFLEFGVYPMLREFAAKLTQKVGPAYGEKLRIVPEDVRTVDREIRIREIETAAMTHTIDEIRRDYYSEGEIGDERGVLTVHELRASVSASPDTGAPEPVEADTIKSAYQIDLDRYRSFAVRRLGREHRRFTSEHIPRNVLNAIHASLSGCKSENDIKQLFDQYSKNDDAARVLDGLANVVKAVRRV